MGSGRDRMPEARDSRSVCGMLHPCRLCGISSWPEKQQGRNRRGCLVNCSICAISSSRMWQQAEDMAIQYGECSIQRRECLVNRSICAISSSQNKRKRQQSFMPYSSWHSGRQLRKTQICIDPHLALLYVSSSAYHFRHSAMRPVDMNFWIRFKANSWGPLDQFLCLSKVSRLTLIFSIFLVFWDRIRWLRLHAESQGNHCSEETRTTTKLCSSFSNIKHACNY